MSLVQHSFAPKAPIHNLEPGKLQNSCPPPFKNGASNDARLLGEYKSDKANLPVKNADRAGKRNFSQKSTSSEQDEGGWGLLQSTAIVGFQLTNGYGESQNHDAQEGEAQEEIDYELKGEVCNRDGDSLTCDALCGNFNLAGELSSLAQCNGIFEILLPDGSHLGVAVDARPTVVTFLLEPSTNSLKTQLMQHRKELEVNLKRHMMCNRNVSITIL